MKQTLLQLLLSAESRYYELKKAIAAGDTDAIIAICCCSLASGEDDIDFSGMYKKEG